MSNTLTYSGQLVTETCCNCGVEFAAPDHLFAARRRDGGTFYCPNGHGQHYTKRVEDKLREQLEAAQVRERQVLDQLAASERSNSALRGQSTKLRKRIAAGVCPCCNRSFQNLSRHMAGQHPNFAGEAS